MSWLVLFLMIAFLAEHAQVHVLLALFPKATQNTLSTQTFALIAALVKVVALLALSAKAKNFQKNRDCRLFYISRQFLIL